MSTRSERLGLPGSSRAAPRDAGPPLAWPACGLVAGALGAAVVALFFLAIDAAHGRALWTPTALGSVLFLGERLSTTAHPGWQPALVVGYTALHGIVFVAFGEMAAFVLGGGGPLRRSPVSATLLTAGALLLCFQAFFLVFALVFLPGLVDDLEAGRVALANGLAALAMASFLVWVSRRGAARSAA